MKFLVWNCDGEHVETVYIGTIQDLQDLYDKYGGFQLVVDFASEYIIIYDGYLE
jgi:hypothetical protein